VTPADFEMPFGPHRGKKLSAIPANYLKELSEEKLLLHQYPGLTQAIDTFLAQRPLTAEASPFMRATALKLPEGFSRFGGMTIGDIVSEDGGIPFLKELAADPAAPSEIRTALDVLFHSLS
jgi:hypothetical protein